MIMPVEMIQDHFENKLMIACANAKTFFDNGNIPDANTDEFGFQIAYALNAILPKYQCTSVSFTNNTDNVCFGIYVNPTIIDETLLKILLTNDEVEFNRYNVEIDCKIFNVLNALEISAYIIEEVSSIMSISSLELTRSIIHETVAEHNGVIDIKQSVNYTQILTFAFKDTLQKAASLLYKPEEAIGTGDIATSLQIKDMLVSIRERLNIALFTMMDVVSAPKLGVLEWCLRIYVDVQGCLRDAEQVLSDAKLYTGCLTVREELDKTIKCIRRAANEVISEAAVKESTKGLSLFQAIKKTGLRGIEEDLFEYKVRVKNCQDQDEAIYLIRQINTRIGIIQDYLSTNENIISPEEKERWTTDMMEFMSLRLELVKKKTSIKKNMGFCVDYDYIDSLG